MGIERFFSTISNKFNIIQDIKYPYSKIIASHIFIDFNSIVHLVSSKIDNPDDKNVIDKVEGYIIGLVKNNFVSDKIKFIMISIDGVPSKAKMIEQKKRRYMGELVSIMTNNKKNNNWSKNNISPGTNFMHLLSQHLNSEYFKQRVEKVCFNLSKLLISDIYKPEEGEKKITNLINNMTFGSNDKIAIYSPDSDVILLGMILKKNIDVILYRHDQQKSDKNYVFNLIDISTLKNIIINYIKDSDFHIKLADQKIIDDIVLIFTIFGDDFLPKINSFDVKNDINIILDMYSLTLLTKKQYLIENNSINFDFLTELLGHMSLLENKVSEHNILDKKYHNYKRFISINFNLELEKLQKSIKNNTKYSINNSFDFIYLLVNHLNKKEIYSTLNRKHQYYHYYFYFLDDNQVIEELKNYCMIKNTNIIPLKNKLNKNSNSYPVKLQTYSISSNDRHHQNNLKDLSVEKKEEYLLNNKLDKYYQKLNVKNGLKKNNKIDDKLIYEYLKGVNWIHQYYFQDNLQNKYWYYTFEYTPMIKDIYQYLKNKKNTKFTYDIVTDQSKFFTVLEQLLFITPFNYNFYLLDNILNSTQIKKVKEFVYSDKYNKFYFDLEKIAKEILFDKENEQIDCHDALYINKCKLIKLSKHYDPDNNFINDFRKYLPYQEQVNIYKINKTYVRILKQHTR